MLSYLNKVATKRYNLFSTLNMLVVSDVYYDVDDVILCLILC